MDALRKRQSSFGTLLVVFNCEWAPHRMPFSHANLKRLFEHGEVFEKLDICCLDKHSALLPFSVKVYVLEYHINSNLFQPEDLASVHIATKDFSLTLHLDNDLDNWGNLPISF